MKNFSMPKQVSPTLEIDELMRLKHSLEKNVSREVAESIIKEIPLSINSTPDIRAEWVEKLSAILENRFDKKTVKNIRQECYCNENGRLEDTANNLKQLYLSLDKDLHRFVNALNENGAGWFIKVSFFVNLPNAFVTYMLKYEQFPVMRASSTIAADVTLVLIGLILLLYRNADQRIRRL